MMSLSAIQAASDEAAREAAETNLEPYVPYNVAEIDRYPSFPFPMLGDYVPDGWEQTDESWFCDMSGFGRDDEPALSVEQFKRALREYVAENPGHGFAIIEAGQFQCYVAAYKPSDDFRIGLNDD